MIKSCRNRNQTFSLGYIPQTSLRCQPEKQTRLDMTRGGGRQKVDPETRKAFADRLKQAIDDFADPTLNERQKIADFARKTNLVYETVRSLTKAKSVPDIATLLKLREKTGRELEWWLPNKNSKSKAIDQKWEKLNLYVKLIDRITWLTMMMKMDPRADVLPVLDGIINRYGQKLPDTPEIKTILAKVSRPQWPKKKAEGVENGEYGD